MFDRLLCELRRDDWFQAALAASRLQEPRAAERDSGNLRPDLAEALRRLGTPELYAHQAEILRLARAGRNVVVCTPTSSGKTLGFNLPVLETVLAEQEAGREAHALYLFPLKALAQDQLRELWRLRSPPATALSHR